MARNLGDFRPERLNDFVGFEAVKQNLLEQIEVLDHDIQEAIERDRGDEQDSFDRLFVSAPHILMVGLPGFGKTTLAELYAAEMSAAVDRFNWPRNPLAVTDFEFYRGSGAPTSADQFRFARLDATMLEDWETLDAYLFEMHPYGVLLIDEIHNLRPSLQEHLLELLHDGTWESPRGGRRLWHMGWTLIGTTTDESRLRDAFLSRFDTVIELREYLHADLHEIVRFTAERVGITLTDAAVDVIAERGRGTPRDIVKIVRKLRDLAVLDGEDDRPLDRKLAIRAAQRLGYGPYGLGPRDVDILKYIHDHGPVGAKTLARALRFGTVSNFEDAEEYLVREGWVVPDQRGRALSERGQRLLHRIEDDCG
jgi:holliday junction DNA helicase RuvB